MLPGGGLCVVFLASARKLGCQGQGGGGGSRRLPAASPMPAARGALRILFSRYAKAMKRQRRGPSGTVAAYRNPWGNWGPTARAADAVPDGPRGFGGTIPQAVPVLRCPTSRYAPNQCRFSMALVSWAPVDLTGGGQSAGTAVPSLCLFFRRSAGQDAAEPRRNSTSMPGNLHKKGHAKASGREPPGRKKKHEHQGKHTKTRVVTPWFAAARVREIAWICDATRASSRATTTRHKSMYYLSRHPTQAKHTRPRVP